MKKNIYLAHARDTDLYKIGITKKDPAERLKQLQTGNANELVLVESFETGYDYKMEAGVHAHFKMKKVSNEWFTLTEDDLKLFYSVCERLEATFKILEEQNTYLSRNLLP